MSNFPNTVSVAQLLSLSSMSQPISELSTIAPNTVACKTVLCATTTQSQLTSIDAQLLQHNAESGDGLLSSTISAGIRPAILARADGGGGDGSDMPHTEHVDANVCCHHPQAMAGAFQLVPSVGAGDDVDVSTIALLSELQPEHATVDQVQLQEILMQHQQQQQWQLHLGQMMQLDVLHKQQGSGTVQQPLVADTADLLWNQQQQAAVMNSGLTGEQLMQQQQMLIQQQQQMLKQAYAQQQLMEMRYNNMQMPIKTANNGSSDQPTTTTSTQSPQMSQSQRQKTRVIAKGNNNYGDDCFITNAVVTIV